MQNVILANSPVAKMTSIELVDFINAHRKQEAEGAGREFPSKDFAKLSHRDFMAKVAIVIGEGVCEKFRTPYIHPQNGQTYSIFSFPKREACLMAMSYSYDLQAKVFDRMTALESGPVLHIPQTLSEALHLAADIQDQKDKAEAALAIAAPKAEALDRMTLADGEVCLQTAGKLLQQPPNKFIAWLRSLGTWIFKRPGSRNNSAYSDKINAGYLNVRTMTTIMPDGSERVNEQVVVTPKGLAKLSMMLGVQPDMLGGV